MLGNNGPIFKAIYAGVRPARVITFVNESDKEWVHTCFRIIEWYSQMWGGSYNLMIPTNGESIKQEFWLLMEAFDPDYIFSYQKTMLDFKLHSPEKYSEWLEHQVNGFLQQNPHSERESVRASIDDQIRRIEIDKFRISDSLKRDILSRLNPFRDDGVGHLVYALDGVHYPLTSLMKILPNSDVSTIFDLKVEADDFVLPTIYAASGLLCGFKVNLSKQIEESSRQSGGLRILTAEADALESIRENIQEVRYASDQVKSLLRFVWSGARETAGVGDLFRYTPFATTLVGLEFYHRGHPESWRMPVVLVTGDTVNDFCLYYALCRLRGQVYWLPSALVNSVTEEAGDTGPTPGHRNLLFSFLSEIVEQIDYGHSEKRILLTSLSKSKEELDLMLDRLCEAYPIQLGVEPEGKNGKAIRDFVRVSTEVSELLAYVIQVFERNNYPTYYGTEQFIDGESHNYISTPRPKTFRKIDPNGHYWIAELNVEGYKLPPKSVLGTMVVKHRTYSNREVRISKYGINYHCPNIAYFGGDIDTTLVRPKLGLPAPMEVFRAIFAEAGYEIAMSDKGSFQDLCMSKFGGLENMAKRFMSAKYRALFDKAVDETPNTQGVYDEGVFLHKGEPRYLDLPLIKKIVGSDEDIGQILGDLLEKGIFHRGFIFKCDKCKNTDWYSIHEVEDTFVCKRCRFQQVYSSSNLMIQETGARLEPKWHYRLDEVVYQGYKHDMIVPVLTLYKLQRLTKESFLFVPEIELWQQGVDLSRPYLEIDVCCVVDGEIVVGECKKGDKLEATAAKEKAKLARHRHIIDSIGASGAAFATLSDDWRQGTKNLIHQAFLDTRVSVNLMSKDDLLT